MMREENRRLLKALGAVVMVSVLIFGGYLLATAWPPPGFGGAEEPLPVSAAENGAGDLLPDLPAALDDYNRAQAQCRHERGKIEAVLRLNAEWMIADVARGYYAHLETEHLHERAGKLAKDLRDAARANREYCPLR